VAPDRRLVDRNTLGMTRRLAEEAITYVEQQLGQRTLRPPSGTTLLRRLNRLRDDLDQLAGILAALEHQADSEQPTPLD
jgi:hypothetical protein